MWLIPPMLFYWLVRVWHAVRNGALKEDPLLYTLCDKQTYVLGLLTGLIIYYAI